MKWILILVFLIRYSLAMAFYNADIDNHTAWMNNVQDYGWQGLYERDMSPRAQANYPPLTLYTFWIGEKVYQLSPVSWQTPEYHAVWYKVPSLIADCLVAWLIWRFTKFKPTTKVIIMAAYLLNPALAYNSVFWGQIEGLVTAFTILAIIMLAEGKSAYALIAYTVAVLTKQNAAPLLPIILYGIWLVRPRWQELTGGILVSLSLFFLSYLPLTPRTENFLTYPVMNYLSSIGGQSHQWQASVNALNYWYFRGFNLTMDSKELIGTISIRSIGMIFTAAAVVLAVLFAHRYRNNKYQSLFLGASILSLWTYTFASRMHERHSYMMIAYLTFLLPTMRFRWSYLTLSAVSFYNLYVVWQQLFYYNWGQVWWINWTRVLSLVVVLIVLFFPLWLIPRDRS